MEKRCFFALRFHALDSCDIAPDYDLLPLCRFRFPLILERNYSAFKLDFNGFSEPRQQISRGQGIHGEEISQARLLMLMTMVLMQRNCPNAKPSSSPKKPADVF